MARTDAETRGRGRAGRIRDERGFALVELLVTLSLLTVVLSAVALFGDTSAKVAPRDQERTHAIREAQTGLYRMTRELRQAHTVHASTPLTMEVSVVSGGANKRISYECDQPHPTETSYRRCIRYLISGGLKTTPDVVVDRVLNTTTVFTYTNNIESQMTYVQAKVDVPARGDRKLGHGNKHKVALYDGFYLRNIDLGK
jgi:prepilin-type N-terminal cleavage/methylation domain-containing protein